MPRLEETTGKKCSPKLFWPVECVKNTTTAAFWQRIRRHLARNWREEVRNKQSPIFDENVTSSSGISARKDLVRGNDRQASPWTSGFTRKWAWFRTRTSANGKDSALASQRVKIELERKLLEEIPARKHQEWSISSRFSAGKALVRGNGRQASIEGEDSALARQNVKIELEASEITANLRRRACKEVVKSKKRKSWFFSSTL